MKIQVVVGAQFGSEAKGHVTARLIKAHTRGLGERVANIRVAGPNAGHTVIDNESRPWPLRSVPVGGALGGMVDCYIAAGSEIDAEVTLREFDQLRDAGHRPFLMIDPEATMLTDKHKSEEGNVSLVDRVGSTGKGIGACRADRIMRSAQRVIDDVNFLEACSYRGIEVAPVAENVLTSEYGTIVIEGTQGYGLGLRAGFYPQCTSSDTRAIDFLAMAGLSPWHPRVGNLEVWAVARVYPIRVAGNSGPLKGETTWDALGLPEERTTVTKKVRRVGAWDGGLVARAVEANGGTPTVRLALTMVDQKFPTLRDCSHMGEMFKTPGFNEFLHQVESDAHARVALVTTGPASGAWI